MYTWHTCMSHRRKSATSLRPLFGTNHLDDLFSRIREESVWMFTCIRDTHIYVTEEIQRQLCGLYLDPEIVSAQFSLNVRGFQKNFEQNHWTRTNLLPLSEFASIWCTGWRRPIGCLKLQVIFRKRATDYRAHLQKMTYEDKASYDSTLPCMGWLRLVGSFKWDVIFAEYRLFYRVPLQKRPIILRSLPIEATT